MPWYQAVPSWRPWHPERLCPPPLCSGPKLSVVTPSCPGSSAASSGKLLFPFAAALCGEAAAPIPSTRLVWLLTHCCGVWCGDTRVGVRRRTLWLSRPCHPTTPTSLRGNTSQPHREMGPNPTCVVSILSASLSTSACPINPAGQLQRLRYSSTRPHRFAIRMQGQQQGKGAKCPCTAQQRCPHPPPISLPYGADGSTDTKAMCCFVTAAQRVCTAGDTLPSVLGWTLLPNFL